jgi:hypothetical protein
MVRCPAHQMALAFRCVMELVRSKREFNRIPATIRPLTPDLWPALEDLFGENGAVGGNWCMYWRIGRAIRENPREENKAAFRKVVRCGPRPGLLAFDGGMVPAHAARRAARAESHLAAQAGGRCLQEIFDRTSARPGLLASRSWRRNDV